MTTDPIRERLNRIDQHFSNDELDAFVAVLEALIAVLDEVDAWSAAGQPRRGSVRKVIADALEVQL